MDVLNKEYVMQIAKEFAVLVRSDLDNSAEIYVFGSAARNEMHEDSDIDIAVVSNSFTTDAIDNRVKLLNLSQKVSWNIEPHPITHEYWTHTTPFEDEVKKDGIIV
ncbi:MAG: nucleotidyltransferase domain-containing protein [Oscillospiraceae bacterium]|nr:nucleotidyltransferase domain-containing protein [Oscillospiraceae bacterium]